VSERSFGSRVAGLTTVRFVAVVAGFFTNVIAARLLGSDGVGAAGIAVVLAIIAAVVCNGGVNIWTIFLLGRRPDRPNHLIGALVPLAAAGAILAALLVFGSGATLGPVIGLADRPDLFMAAAALAAVIVTYEFLGAVVLGLGRTRAYVAAELLRGAASFLLTAALLFILWRSDVGFVVAMAVAIAVAGSLNAASIVQSVGVTTPRIDASVAREALGIGLRGQVGSILQLVSLRLDQLLVAAFLTLSSAGVYLIAARVSEAIAQVGSAAGLLIFPEVARHGDPLETSLTERVVRTTSVMIVGAALVVGVLAEPLLAIAFGPTFAEGSLALRLLMIAMLPLTAGRVLAGDLKGRGRPGTVSFAMAVAAGVTILLDLVLIPRYGIEGAAIASVVAYTISAAILATAFVRLTGADARSLVPRPADAMAILRFLRTIRVSAAITGR
jgi:O-antigen/teichoic acid export membrane protein